MNFLIIDDHKVFCQSMVLALQCLYPKSKVYQAYNLKKAAAELEKSRINYIFLDYNIAENCGLSLFEDRDQSSLPPVIMLSANEEPITVLACLEKGAIAFLPKTIGLEEIKNCIKHAKKRKTYLPKALKIKIEQYKSNTKQEKSDITKKLTNREKDILLLISKGYNNKDIANALGVSYSTIKKHLSKMLEIFEAENRAECISKAIHLNII